MMYGERWGGLREAMLADPLWFRLQEGLAKPYFLNEASVLAARCLRAQVGDRILDCCAAPGGKSLVILSALLAQGGGGSGGIDMVVNDRSAARRARLRRVLSEHLPEPLAEQIKLTGHDAGRWGLYEPEAYDKIILDVPCSSERHLLASPAHLARWSPARSRHLAQQAYAFLLSALRALKSGGSLVYATCALTAAENDEVVNRALERVHRKKLMEVQIDTRCELPDWVEGSPAGFIVLPDKAGGRGPLFFSRLEKIGR